MKSAGLAAALLLASAANAAEVEERVVPLDGCTPTFVQPAQAAAKSNVFCREAKALLLDESTGASVDIPFSPESIFPGPIRALAGSPDGSHTAIAFFNGEVIVFRTDWSIAGRWKRDSYAVRLTFTPDGTSLYVDGAPEWPGTQAALPSLKGRFGPTLILFGADDVYGMHADTRIERVALTGGQPPVVADDELVEGLAATLSDNGKLLFVGMADGRIVTRDAMTLATLRTAAGASGTMVDAVVALGEDRALVRFRPQIGGPGASFALLGSDGTLEPFPGGDEVIGLVGRDGAAILYMADPQGLRLKIVR